MHKLEKSHPTDGQLKQVAQLAEMQVRVEEEIACLETRVAEEKEKLSQLSEHTIPDAMAEAGIAEFTLADGSKVEVKPYYNAKIPPENKDEAFQWLEDNGHAALIKHQFVMAYDREDTTDIQYCRDILAKARIPFNDQESVNSQTLKAFVREQVEAGNAIPLDLLGAHVGQRTKIKKKE